MKRALIWAGAALCVIVGLMAISLATGTWQYLTAPFFGRVEAERQLESGASRIALYNQFHNRCAGVRGIEGQIDAQRTLLASLDGDDLARTQINIAGLEARRAQEIARYNADTAKDYTAARFLDADLPFRLPSIPYDGSNRTVCTAQ